MLNIVNVTRRYEDLIVVNKFKGESFPGEIFCLLGHNGAGKTTLIKMIYGIEDPDEGDIFFDYLIVEVYLKYMCEIKGRHGKNKWFINKNRIK